MRWTLLALIIAECQ